MNSGYCYFFVSQSCLSRYLFFKKFSGQLVCFLRKRRKRKKFLQILNTGYCYFFVSQPHLKVQKFEFRVLLFLCFSVSFSAIWDRKSKAKTFFFHEKKRILLFNSRGFFCFAFHFVNQFFKNNFKILYRTAKQSIIGDLAEWKCLFFLRVSKNYVATN